MGNTVSLPTSPEVRAKLEAAGYRLLAQGPDFEKWLKGGFRFTLRKGLVPGIAPMAAVDYALPLELALEFAAILGITPPGMCLVPVPNDVPIENLQAFAMVQRKNADWLDNMTQNMQGDKPADEISEGNYAEARMWRRLADIADALVAALSQDTKKGAQIPVHADIDQNAPIPQYKPAPRLSEKEGGTP